MQHTGLWAACVLSYSTPFNNRWEEASSALVSSLKLKTASYQQMDNHQAAVHYSCESQVSQLDADSLSHSLI